MDREINVLFDEKKRDKVVSLFLDKIILLLGVNIKLRILDIGAGPKKYEGLCNKLGMNYFSHDFAKYKGANSEPNTDIPGFREETWPSESNYDMVSDILELPIKFCDIALLTEVLEHVPDPVLALNKVSESINSRGFLIVSVPSHSLIHQAPFYFSSGLSEFWFKEHCKRLDLEIIESVYIGDYLDFINLHSNLYLPSYLLGALRVLRILKNIVLRPLLAKNLLSSSSCGLILLIRKMN
jgi:SAM-dependent methyltransferase